MMQAALHRFPDTEVEYQFRCRNGGVLFSQAVIDRIDIELDRLCRLKFTKDEIAYLRTIRFFKKDFVDFLQIFRLQREFVKVEANAGRMAITISGPWLHTILFEVFVLAIVNECYFAEQFQQWVKSPEVSNKSTVWPRDGYRCLKQKFELLKTAPEGFTFAEFGTRRRFSREWQDTVVKELKGSRLVGTSNVFLAKKYGLTPVGTMAHEFIQAGQGLRGVRLEDSQKFMLEAWVQEYRGDLGIALSDTLGLDTFLTDFDLYFAKLFDGVRQDSGDPYAVGKKIIQHYEKFRIDPTTKTILFSDGLDIPKAIDLYNYFKEYIKVGFGIGTDLVNDCGFTPLNIVIKMTRCNGNPVAKISDSEGKTICEDEHFLKHLRHVIKGKVGG
jgi:nicotinate phosphoribosyltransferase